MAEIEWIVVVPLLVGGTAGLWWLAKLVLPRDLLLTGVLLNMIGTAIYRAFLVVADGATGMRYGSFFRRSAPDVGLALQTLGIIAVVHGIVLLFKRKRREASQQQLRQVSSESAPSASPGEPSS